MNLQVANNDSNKAKFKRRLNIPWKAQDTAFNKVSQSVDKHQGVSISIFMSWYSLESVQDDSAGIRAGVKKLPGDVVGVVHCKDMIRKLWDINRSETRTWKIQLNLVNFRVSKIL